MKVTRCLLGALLAAVTLVALSCEAPTPVGVDSPAPPLLGDLILSPPPSGLLQCSSLPSASVTQTIGPEGGTLQVGPMTVSEVFVGQYNTDEQHMPIQSVASIACDSRSGVPITWDNLFVDKQAGLTRLGDATAAALADVAPPDHVRDWRRQGQFAPVDINFRAWIPTAAGIELHFPEFQFGGGLKVVTVPWATVADQIRPEFTPIMGG